MNDPSLNSFYINTGDANSLLKLEGINNLSISKNISFSDLYSLGGLESSLSINAPQVVEVSFDRFLFNTDILDVLFQYTGSNPISEAYLVDSKKYKINDLYLQSYSAGFSIGELPKINTKFLSFGSNVEELSNSTLLSSSNASQNISMPTLGSIFISGSNLPDDFIKNIYSFEYNIEINRQPYYTIGSLLPTEVCEILPLKITLSINSKVYDNSLVNIFPSNFYKNSTNQNSDKFNFNLVVKNTGDSSFISYPSPNSTLVSSSIQASSNNTLEIKRNFVGYYGL